MRLGVLRPLTKPEAPERLPEKQTPLAPLLAGVGARLGKHRLGRQRGFSVLGILGSSVRAGSTVIAGSTVMAGFTVMAGSTVIAGSTAIRSTEGGSATTGAEAKRRSCLRHQVQTRSELLRGLQALLRIFV